MGADDDRRERDQAEAGPGGVTPEQAAMLGQGAEGHFAVPYLLFSALIDGPLRVPRLAAVLRELAARHPALRTSFELDERGGWRRRVGERWTPPLRESTVAAAGADRVAAAQAVLAAAGPRCLGGRPVGFFLMSDPSGSAHVLSLLAHPALLDVWSVGMLWRELVGRYGGAVLDYPPDAGPDAVVARWVALEEAGRIEELAHEQARRLAGAPDVVEFRPGEPVEEAGRPAHDLNAARLAFRLSPDAVAACGDLSDALAISRDAVLAGAWALVLARRCGADDLLLEVAVTGRSPHPQVVGQCGGTIPVRCRPDGASGAAEYLRRMADLLAEAERCSDVTSARLGGLPRTDGDRSRPRLPFAFEAHDGLVPERLSAGGLTFEIVEGESGGSPWDAKLSVRRWGPDNRVVLEYSPAVLGPEEAAWLAEGVEAALLDLAARRDRPLAEVSTVSAGQKRLLDAWGRGAAVRAESTLWGLISRRAALGGHEPAVWTDGEELTYAELVERAEGLAGRLHAAGVGRGDHVLIDLPRGTAEIVGVLATVRLGAVYVGVDRHAPPAQCRDLVRRLAPRALLVSGTHPAAMRPHVGAECAVVDATVPVPGGGVRLPEPLGDPESPVYVSFTSGSTGRPKGVRVPQRGIVRLVAETDYVRGGPGERFLRLSPLAFDASTLEIFAPLTSGACLHVFTPESVIPGALARFVARQDITVLWLTAGLFRLVAEHYPAAFAGVRQVLTGGDVVPVEQVRALVAHHPGLRVTNGYGPTESTTFTTVHHVDSLADIAEPLPIGRPIQGTEVLVADGDGTVLPPGATGELWIGGQGLALDYLGDEAATGAAFVRIGGRMMYRTGDLVRWDELGRLRFLGRRDRQVKIAGHRVEPVAVERVLREHPAVADVVVVVDDSPGFGKRLLAGVVASEVSEEELREFAGQRLARYAVPTAWAFVEAVPLTRNGKVDVAALRAGR
ncbi:amino acid adenylation domain-containing protein [Microbispora sp. CA-102843]|uniref:amino acid adenylation domain-containing protein n=1 Tax=Microbispora sp. CA-102843 TaxID=3239952 RepID=UPI003D941ABC